MSPSAQFVSSTMRKLFAVPAIWNVIRKDAKSKIVEKGKVLGLDMDAAADNVSMPDLQRRLTALTNPALEYPAYYTKPFHAYDHGNLSWDAALEVTMASVAVHAAVMDPAGKALDPAGDERMRAEFHALADRMMGKVGCRPVREAVDLGCSVGISSQALQRATGASVIAVDASPYFLAVGEQLQDERLSAPGADAAERIDYRHALAEATGLSDSSADLVAMSLVFHELPASASKAIMAEALRILRPGGCFIIMELDPMAPASLRMLQNPFASAAFNSTEPWLSEYVALDMEASLEAAGFVTVLAENNTPRHKSVVAHKAFA